MATPEGIALTEQHRVDQVALVAALIRQLATLWRTLTLDNVDAAWAAIRATLLPQIARQHATSARLAGGYYRNLRRAENVPGRPRIVTARALPERLTGGTLDVVGPLQFKQAVTAGRTPVEARDRALVTTAGAVQRLVLDGGRSTLLATVEDDNEAVGWARVTDEDPCAFCAMLASRGFVYKSRQSAGAPTQWHTQCGCSVVPAFSDDEPLPGRSREFQDLWYEATGDHYADEKRKAFRRAYEAQQHAGRGGVDAAG